MPDVRVVLRHGEPGLRQRRAQLRRGIFQAQLRIAGQDKLLPDWVQAGLAAYVSGEGPTEPTQERGPSGGSVMDDEQREVLLVRYLLEGDDAKYASDFSAAMAATLAQYPQDPFHSPIGWNEKVKRLTPSVPRPRSFPLDKLIAEPAVQQGFSQWLAGAKPEQANTEPKQPDIEASRTAINEFGKDPSQ